MKTTLMTLLVIFTFVINSCSNGSGATMTDAVITGYDPAMCACCGGVFISIDNQTYRFDSVPAGSTIKLENETFPIMVRVNWHKRPNQCMGNEIILDKLEKR